MEYEFKITHSSKMTHCDDVPIEYYFTIFFISPWQLRAIMDVG